MLPKPYQLRRYERLDSSNSQARRLGAEGAVDPTVVWTTEQSAGKGRRGRTWISEPGNLYFSVLLRPACPPRRGGELSFVAALAVAQAVCERLPAAQITCKWPNDVLVNGRKVAGILLESDLELDGEGISFVIVGVGVNVASHPPEQTVRRPATSLAAEGGEASDIVGLLRFFCFFFSKWRTIWEEEGFLPIRQAWTDRAHGLNSPIRVDLPGGSKEGIFRGLDRDGSLLMERGGVRERIVLGDVFPLERLEG